MDLSDSVDGVRSHDAQVRHVDPLAPLLLDQGHLPQLVHVLRVESCDFLQRQKRTRLDSARPNSRRRRVLGARDSYVEVALVDLVDDLQVSRQQGLQQVHGPALQSFRQDGVVGVGEGAPGQVPGLPEEKHRITRDDSRQIQVEICLLTQITSQMLRNKLPLFVVIVMQHRHLFRIS